MKVKRFSISVREEGRGKPTVYRFTELAQAEAWIKEHWQGSDYIDGNDGFHTDYSTFEMKGFTFQDIGRFSYKDGCREFTFEHDDRRNYNPETGEFIEPAEYEYGESRPTSVYSPKPLPTFVHDPAVVPF